MKKRYVVNLTAEERAALTQIVNRERVSGLKRLRASILLKADDGLTDEEIAACDWPVRSVETGDRIRQKVPQEQAQR